MPAPRRQTHAYLQDDMDKVKNVPLPAKIKCGRCNRFCVPASFSNKQLTDARYQVMENGRMTKTINCKKCTGQQIVEIKCTVCERTHGLEEYAKAQRKDPDTAICFACMERQVNDAAIREEVYQDQDKAFLPADHSNGNVPEYWSSQHSATDALSADGDEWSSITDDTHDSKNKDTGVGGIPLSSHFQAMQLTSSVDDSLIGSEYEHPAAGNNTGIAEVHSNKSWHTASAGPRSTGSKLNQNAYGNASLTTPSGSVHSFASSVAERSSREIRSNGWTKIRSARNHSPVRCGPMTPMGDTARDSESVVDAWDSDSDDDAAEDDDDSDDETVI
ncbi:hypothetical protein T440DRAFT_74324 [Plenodomus tracheiphilus IPT5]|uniref:Stc1 domain-containing protein n=1 Tax=Plenodomus tracheiphilus IPT5 TaxID=1408161 RepID=A0A6A7B6E3_9PLEO|nr:hypothetical protein T440DRAFT_74324 [Plenodomus tracheiphilus IPT5]